MRLDSNTGIFQDEKLLINRAVGRGIKMSILDDFASGFIFILSLFSSPSFPPNPLDPISAIHMHIGMCHPLGHESQPVTTFVKKKTKKKLNFISTSTTLTNILLSEN